VTSHEDQDNNKRRRKELVLMKGCSGVGKSTLANTLEDKVHDLKNGIFVRGNL
jgi:adenylylsulfate kinase-like enzyme